MKTTMKTHTYLELCLNFYFLFLGLKTQKLLHAVLPEILDE